MRLVSFEIGQSQSWGIIEGANILDVGAVMGEKARDIKQAIAQDLLSDLTDAVAQAKSHAVSEVRLLPVIPNPEKILCVGLNYETHRAETKRAVVGHPTIFARYANSQMGHGADVVIPRVSSDMDFEGELALIISKTGRYIGAADAWDYVAGYSCYNDCSVRDYQSHTHQFIPGKNFPNTGAFGPEMVTADEFGAVGPQKLQTRVNGEVVQDAQLDQMIFDIPTVISYCSEFTILEPGDVIVMGTPGGVGAKRVPPLWLKAGDVVDVSIDGIGKLSNPVMQEV